MGKNLGVLALQGDFAKHRELLRRLGLEAAEVRTPADLEPLEGLIIPGGESTTIGKLLVKAGLLDPIVERARGGMAVFGTCAGAILLANTIEQSSQPRLGLMDIAVHRNAYGRQIESFEADVQVPVAGQDPVHAIFIRAPIITEVRDSAEVLARFEDQPVLVRQGRFLACTFHPEITGDPRVHQYFLSLLG